MENKVSREEKARLQTRFFSGLDRVLRNRFMKCVLPVLGGIMIGLLSFLIMRFMGKHLSF
jgi:hypothetical protein